MPEENDSYPARINAALRRHKTFATAVDYNRQHYLNKPAANPSMLAPLEHIKYQTAQPWIVGIKLKGRVCENHWQIKCEAPSSAKQGAADRAEKLLHSLLWDIEERQGYLLQEGLADGQVVDARGWLHWRYNPKLLGKDGKVKSTSDGPVLEIHRSPYIVQTVPCDQVMEEVDPDTGEIKCVYWVREWAYDAYKDKEADDTLTALAAGTLNLRDNVGRQTDPGGNDDNDQKFLTVCTVWEADEWCEYVHLDRLTAGTDGNWEKVPGKEGEHAFGMVPWAPANALTFLSSSDPVDRYRPYLDAMFRQKESLDRMVAVMQGLAELVALPEVWLVRNKVDATPLKEDGKPVLLSRDAMSAYVLPDGYELQKLDRTLDPAFVKMIEGMANEFKEAAPQTGMVDMTASTQPWLARQWSAQESTGPRIMIGQQLRALRPMVRSILRHMSASKDEGGLGDNLSVLVRDPEGRVTNERISVSAKDLADLNVDIVIETVSEAERITLAQFGLTLYQAGVIDIMQLYEEFMLIPDATKVLMDRDIRQIFEQYLKPGIVAKETTGVWGPRVVMGTNAEATGMQGQQIPPEDVLARNGYQRMAAQRGVTQTTMPEMSDSIPAETGVIQQPALPG